MYAFDALTWQQLWKSDQKGGIWGYGGAIAYNKVYQGSYDGIFYAFDANNGQVVWTFNLNDYNAQQGLSVPDVYASNGWGWPWQCQPVAADGKVYAVSEQHSPNQPRVAGHHLFAFDAETGDILWTFPASGASNSNPIVADDLLFVSNTYTNQLMCFGKGPTAIELSVPQARIETGDYTWINGRITDQSPAQKDTPAVSKESMDAWMAYLNGGESMPTTVTGVPVKLTAVSSSGQVIDIGTVTSDSNGYFQSKWTPPSEDAYTIKADFAGDDSYWSSTQRTDLAVGKATVSQQTSQSTTQDYTLLFDALIAGVAVAIIVGVVNIAALRKLKK
jgi:outer membrane protein assembly factor BamB